MPRGRLAVWLTAPTRSIGPEGDAELRKSMFRRLEAVVVSAVASMMIATVALSYHPTEAFAAWFAVDGVLLVMRTALVFHILRVMKPAGPGKTMEPWVIDLFMVLGTLWSVVLGIGIMMCLAVDDHGLSLLASFVAMGTVSGQCARSPGTPRLNALQMTLIAVPVTAGALASTTPLMAWCALVVPFYLFAMIVITRQLHDDFVNMIAARIENRQRALHCALTKLPNGMYFSERLVSALRYATSSDPVTVLCLDLDGFKAVNDTLGHPIGDILLTQVAERLRCMEGPGTMVARIGGDEFAAFTQSGGKAGGEAMAAALIAALSRPYALGNGVTATIGASVGIATDDATLCEGAAADATRLLSQADQALYRAKRAGKGTFRHYCDDVGPPGSEIGGSLQDMAQRMRDAYGPADALPGVAAKC